MFLFRVHIWHLFLYLVGFSPFAWDFVVFFLLFFLFSTSCVLLPSAQRTTIVSTSLRILVQKLLFKFFETFYSFSIQTHTNTQNIHQSLVYWLAQRSVLCAALVFNEFFRILHVYLMLSHSYTPSARYGVTACASSRWTMTHSPNYHEHTRTQPPHENQIQT